MIMVSVPSLHVSDLKTAQTSLTNVELTIAVKTASPSASAAREGPRLYVLRLQGADHNGIVSAYLAKQGIDVVATEKEIAAAPRSDAPLFQMEAPLEVQPSLALDKLHDHGPPKLNLFVFSNF